MNTEQARAAIRELGEFVMANPGPDCTVLTFVNYEPGARTGKFHSYKYLSLSPAVYEEIKDDLT